MTTQPTLTLTAFLLDCIADDKVEAQRLHDLADQVGRAYGHGPPESEMNLGDQAYLTMHILADRVLAECEAKRRIVSLFAPTLNDEWAAANGEWDEAAWKGKLALLALALPYADHPDYREEWRP